jgi:hypothetical protein
MRPRVTVIERNTFLSRPKDGALAVDFFCRELTRKRAVDRRVSREIVKMIEQVSDSSLSTLS